mgnify:CR=1 FL=1
MDISEFEIVPPSPGNRIRHAKASPVNTFIPAKITTDNDVDRNINKIVIEKRMHNIENIAKLDASQCHKIAAYNLDGVATIIRDKVLSMRKDEELNLNYNFMVGEYGQENARILLITLDSMFHKIKGLRMKYNDGIINIGYRI